MGACSSKAALHRPSTSTAGSFLSPDRVALALAAADPRAATRSAAEFSSASLMASSLSIRSSALAACIGGLLLSRNRLVEKRKTI